MIRPRKMKHVQMTVLKSDINAVIEYLGRHGTMHFGESDNAAVAVEESADSVRIKGLLEKLRTSCEFLGVALPEEPDADSVLPAEAVITDLMTVSSM